VLVGAVAGAEIIAFEAAFEAAYETEAWRKGAVRTEIM